MEDKRKELCEVMELEARSGLFTLGPVKDIYEASELFLDWYHREHATARDRHLFNEYWGFDVERLDPENIKEVETMICNECGCWTIIFVGDDYCYQCIDRKLDGRTRKKTFVVEL